MNSHAHSTTYFPFSRKPLTPVFSTTNNNNEKAWIYVINKVWRKTKVWMLNQAWSIIPLAETFHDSFDDFNVFPLLLIIWPKLTYRSIHTFWNANGWITNTISISTYFFPLHPLSPSKISAVKNNKSNNPLLTQEFDFMILLVFAKGCRFVTSDCRHFAWAQTLSDSNACG